MIGLNYAQIGGSTAKRHSDARRRASLASARTARTNAQKAVANLLKLVESGALGPDDPLVAERIASQRARERTLATEIEGIERQLRISKRRITPDIVRTFGAALSERLRDGDPNFRRAYVSLLVERVELSNDTIVIKGSKAALEHALIKDGETPPSALPIFDREWCRLQDSNL